MEYEMEKKQQYERWTALSAEFRRVQAEYLTTLDASLNHKMRVLTQQLRELEELMLWDPAVLRSKMSTLQS
jgi:hypothetical protein